jgi:hypothetical protein
MVERPTQSGDVELGEMPGHEVHPLNLSDSAA